MRPRLQKFLAFGLGSLFTLFLIGALGAIGTYAYLAPKLPSVDMLKDVQLQVPLRVFTRDGRLLAEFGEMKRTPLHYKQFPPQLIHAVLAAEDDRFFEHPGVDYQGIVRAAVHLAATGVRSQGGSTITMQVARNFFLTREKTFLRKINEIMLALKIDHELTKEEILELYLNKIYLGNRAYGVAAAAQVYYGKDLADLSLAQLAMIAGLPKAPSRYNPLADAHRALLRRDYVLGRMRELGFINDAQYAAARSSGVTASYHGQDREVEAPYVAEMARAQAVNRFGEDAYTAGYNVYTTITAPLQTAANRSLRDALIAYDQRHGYRGPEAHADFLDLDADATGPAGLESFPTIGGLVPARVLQVDDDAAAVYAYTAEGRVAYIAFDHMDWARPALPDGGFGPRPSKPSDVVQAGDVIRVRAASDGCSELVEVPEVSGALVSLRPQDGAILALVGGFDFYQSKFNRAVQAQRQPGSNFKPFVYAAALDKGFTPATIINDAPVVFDDPGLEDTWRPENYSGRFFGPTRLRQALIHSRNLVSIRLLRSIGVGYAIHYVSRFGFPTDHLPRNLSLALGSGAITPLQLVSGYAVFANGGYRVQSHFIDRIENSDGEVVYRPNPPQACPDCEEASGDGEGKPVKVAAPEPTPPAVPDDGSAAAAPPPIVPAKRVLSPQTTYLMTSILRDVIRHGTGRGVLRLGRSDLAGKTGTTNDQRDAWFSGFNADIVTTAWVGFDTPRPLGTHETGARAALPMWREYMGAALEGVPETPLKQPRGLVTVRIDAETGRLASADDPHAMFETFRADQVPKPAPGAVTHNYEGSGGTPQESTGLTEQLF